LYKGLQDNMVKYFFIPSLVCI